MSVSVCPALSGLSENYLFLEMEQEAARCRKEHPGKRLLSLGIGDVSQPIAPTSVEALRLAGAEMGQPASRRGYGPAMGYDFLRKAIADSVPAAGGPLSPEEIAVTGGSKEALGQVLALFAPGSTLWVLDPVYPAHRDAALTAGFRVMTLPCRKEENFLPRPERVTEPGIILLCSPNNPTGAVMGAGLWLEWVDFAKSSGSLLLSDAAYAAFALPGTPQSVYETEGAREVAIELGSFSKSAGFTGLRCGWVILPRELTVAGKQLLPFWKRWLSCHANGVSYPVQRAAEAALSGGGQRENREIRALYRRNMARMRETFQAAGIPHWGGEEAPYLWVPCPRGLSSREAYRKLLWERGVLVTPGNGFGEGGEGFLRLSAFGREEDTEEALHRILGAWES